MPQNKIEIRTGGGMALFQKNVLQFAQGWPLKLQIHRDAISAVAQIAAYPDWAVTPVERGSAFWRLYKQDPDFAAALLHFLRRQWKKLDKSKSGRLKRFLSLGYIMKPADGPFALQQSLTDGQIASAYEKWAPDIYTCRGRVEVGDVVKARRAVENKIRAGEQFAKKCFTEDGFLTIKRFKVKRRNPQRKV